jgi:hypothetical protein
MNNNTPIATYPLLVDLSNIGMEFECDRDNLARQ